jgi:hypothetical protein
MDLALAVTMNLYALRQGQRSRHRRPQPHSEPADARLRLRGFDGRAPGGNGPRSPTRAIPVLRDCSPISLRREFRKGTQPAVPGRVILRPFMPIKLKKAPPGLAPRFPSEIRTAQAAIKFVNSLDPKTRAKLHWKLAASALAALDTGAIRQGAYDRSNRQCATLWRLNAGWPTEVGEASHANSRLRADTRGRDGGVCAGGGTPQAQLCPVSGATRKSFARSGFTGFDPERTSGSLRWRSHSVELVTIALRRPGSRQSARPPSLRAPPLRARQSFW